MGQGKRGLFLFSFAALCASFTFATSAWADDMDFGTLESEQVKKGAPSLEEGTPTVEENTSTLSLGGPSKWSEIKRNIGAGYFNYANIKTNELNRGKGYLSTYNYLSLEYRVGRGQKVFIRPAFLFQTAGEEIRRDRNNPQQDSKFAWSDVYLGYSTYSIPWLPFNMDYKSELRVYLPTSETSQNTGMIARIRGDLKAHYPLTSRLTFLLWFKPEYFLQRRTAYTTTTGYVNGTKDYGYELSANLYYQLRGGMFGFGGSVQHEQSWTNPSVAEGLYVFRREDVSAQIFAGINAFGFFTHIGAEQSRNVSRPFGDLVAFNDTEMQYFARSYYRF